LDKAVVVMIGDLVASREIEERVDFDAGLVSRMEQLGANNPFLLSPYTLTIGDEIQAVFSQPERLFFEAFSILAQIYPQRMRFSFSVGRLSKPINPERAIGMDGPAFYAARDGIDGLKKSGYLFAVSGEKIPALGIIRHALNLLSGQVEKWNATRLDSFVALMDGKPVKEIAAELGKSDKTIYKTIQAGELEETALLLKEMTQALKQGVQEG